MKIPWQDVQGWFYRDGPNAILEVLADWSAQRADQLKYQDLEERKFWLKAEAVIRAAAESV